jgi:hypothetical protein
VCKEEKSQRAVAESFALGSSQQKTIKMEGLVWFLFVARRGGCPGLVPFCGQERGLPWFGFAREGLLLVPAAAG